MERRFLPGIAYWEMRLNPGEEEVASVRVAACVAVRRSKGRVDREEVLTPEEEVPKTIDFPDPQ